MQKHSIKITTNNYSSIPSFILIMEIKMTNATIYRFFYKREYWQQILFT